MKTPLSFYLAAAVAGTLAACSSDGGTPRDQTAAGGSAGSGQVGNAGSGAGGSSGSGSQNNAGAGGSSTGGPTTGMPFEITSAQPTASGAAATVVDTAGTTGIDGLAQFIKSPMGTVATSGIKDGALCMSGTTAVVPGTDYANYWGAELDIDLKLVDANGGGSVQTVADAGADAGGDAGPPPARTAVGWNPSTAGVVGFSFKVDGAQIPTAFRFKGLPYGADSSMITYCNQLAVPPTGGTVNVRFDQITRDCWMAGNAALLTQPFPPDNPDGKLLRTISWQVPADITVPFPFDFCVSEIKPILGN
jgi:hypothetical protein